VQLPSSSAIQRERGQQASNRRVRPFAFLQARAIPRVPSRTRIEGLHLPVREFAGLTVWFSALALRIPANFLSPQSKTCAAPSADRKRRRAILPGLVEVRRSEQETTAGAARFAATRDGCIVGRELLTPHGLKQRRLPSELNGHTIRSFCFRVETSRHAWPFASLPGRHFLRCLSGARPGWIFLSLEFDSWRLAESRRAVHGSAKPHRRLLCDLFRGIECLSSNC